jgi:hypothetical protein
MIRVLSAALAGALLIAGMQSYRLAAEQGSHAATRIAHAEQLAQLERAAREAEQNARAEEQRRAAAVQKVADETKYQLDRARADAAAAADAGQRLRDHIAGLTAACGRSAAGHTGPAASGAPAGGAADLLADMQRRLDAAAEGIARHADKASAAGAACERAYESLIR